MKKVTSLKNFRRKYSITQKKMSEVIGINIKTYRNKEEGYTPFLQSEIMKIIIAFDLSPHEAFSMFFLKYLDSHFWMKIEYTDLNCGTILIKDR